MANQGAKKRKDENTRHMSKLIRLIIACNVIYVLVRMLIFHSSTSWKHWIGLIVTSGAYAVPYQQLANMAKPSYSDDGELLDGGFDMSTTGVCGYLHDVIYITSFVQMASILSDKFWYTYLVIPAFGLYQISGLLKGFLSSGSEGEAEDEKSRKKREKMEKKASRDVPAIESLTASAAIFSERSLVKLFIFYEIAVAILPASNSNPKLLVVLLCFS